MKAKKKRREEWFRGDSEQRFNACVELLALGVKDNTILRYLSIDSHMLRKWREDEKYKEKFDEQLKQHRANFASPAAQKERLRKLRVDCGIRRLLHNKISVRFMRDLSIFLDTADAHGNGEPTNGSETVELGANNLDHDTKHLTLKNAIKAAADKGLTVDLNALEAAIRVAAKNVDLNDNDFLNALIKRLQASDGKQQ